MLHKKDDRDQLPEMPRLRIAKLEASRSGRSLCYIDQAILEKLGLSTGDIVEIIGRKRTAGIVVANIADKGNDLIRIDEIQRFNLGSTIGEFVTIQPTFASPAREIELAPTKEIYDIKKQSDVIRGKLVDKPIVAGDIIDIPGAFIKIEEKNNPMNGFMRMLGGEGGTRRPTLGPLRLIVLSTIPNNEVVRFTRDTRIKINKNCVILNNKGNIISSDHVIGLDNEIAEIKRILEISLTDPSFTESSIIDPPSGILLVGPTGVGKTLLAKVIANETNYNFMRVSLADIFQKYQGDSEKKLRQLFELAERRTPCLIFIDHVESFAPLIQKGMISNGWYFEHRMVTLLMELMDGIRQYRNVIVLGATHKYDLIEPALLRPGRFDIILHLSLPDLKSRTKIYQLYTKDLPLDEDISLEQLAELSDNFTGADIKGVCRLAIINAAKREMPELQNGLVDPHNEVVVRTIIEKHDFLKAIEEIADRSKN